MPQEFSRTTKRKRVKLPNELTVDIPVITEISFIDPIQRSQEYQYTIENTAAGDRKVHVDQLHPTPEGDTEQDQDAEPLQVERIDVWKVSDAVARGQESEVTFDNVTGAEDGPPQFRTHLKTHVVRYKNDFNDNTPWIDSELIDKFIVADPVDRGQETIVTLLHPQGTFDESGHEVIVANTDDEDISDTANGIDPPWRTDPFQNIVNFSSEPPHRRREFQTVYSALAHGTPGHYGGSFGISVPPLHFTDGFITDTTDASAAVAQAQATIATKIMATYSGATITEQSGVIDGPSGPAATVSYKFTWWIMAGDGYDLAGNKRPNAPPEASYVTDPDFHLWWYDGVGTPFTSDPGPPPI